MAAAVNAVTGKPDAFKFVCRGNVSAQRRDGVCLGPPRKLGVPKVAIWSGRGIRGASPASRRIPTAAAG